MPKKTPACAGVKQGFFALRPARRRIALLLDPFADLVTHRSTGACANHRAGRAAGSQREAWCNCRCETEAEG
jgi:hypothetical protein